MFKYYLNLHQSWHCGFRIYTNFKAIKFYSCGMKTCPKYFSIVQPILENSKIKRNCIPVYFLKKYFHWFKKSFGKYSIISYPGAVSPGQIVPSNIVKPDYAETGKPSTNSNLINVKNDDEISTMRETCHLARRVLNYLDKYILEGMTTNQIDHEAHYFMVENNCYPSPLNYKGFPKSICTSVNNVAAHGIPDDRELENGDIISVDITVYNNGFHGDCCETFIIGDVDNEGRELVKIARKCRDEAISICGPGIQFKNIGRVIEEIAVENKFTVVPSMLGHGIGRNFHEPPDIYHSNNNYAGIMESGMVFTIEPVLAQGKKNLVMFDDMWTVLMDDDSRAAQFEHTILITDCGYEILTL